MSAALDLRRVATNLLDAKLAILGEALDVHAYLAGYSEEADRPTLLAIARVLLSKLPPPWLLSAVSVNGVIKEHVPTDDWRALEWLGEDLERLLMESAQPLLARRDDRITSALGLLAELVVLKSKRNQGLHATHVSQVSDAFGYDIEVRTERGIERIEVKGALTTTAGQFFITRNEYEKSKLLGREWHVLQVVFKPAILAKALVTARDIASANTLSADELQVAIGDDSSTFCWRESGKVYPQTSGWNAHSLMLSATDEFKSGFNS